MAFKFGFEVEGFYFDASRQVDGDNFPITIPPPGYPHDDFPGLVEARTFGGKGLREQFYMLMSEMDKWENVDWGHSEHTFTPKEKMILRSRHFEKGGIEIGNIYGKSPRDLGSRTLASFQINISQHYSTFTTKSDSKVEEYRPFDFYKIIRNLDEEFAKEISESKRQPGFYSLKDDIRIEYRSLPNFIAKQSPNQVIKRIAKCIGISEYS